MSQSVLLATRKGLFRWNPKNGTTLLGFKADPVTNVLSDARDGTLYASLNLGHYGVKAHRSQDGGKSWEEIAVPKYPEAPEGEKGDNLHLLWTLAAGGKDQPGTLWAGTIPGGLFRSDDRGDSWYLIESLWNKPEREQWFGGGYDKPGIHSICVDPTDSNKVGIGISCGGAWFTEDGGDSWNIKAKGMFAAFMPDDRKYDQNIQDPHCMVQSPSSPNVLWVQHHNAMFRTTDYAENWVHLDKAAPSEFGFPVAVHPQHPDTAWFVPATKDDCRMPVDGKMVVSRTTDGGKSFEVLREGLPQEHAYDIVYRHALDVGNDGKCLAVGSTTGSFWYSENGGDSWKLINAHLPPVYAVHFEHNS